MMPPGIEADAAEIKTAGRDVKLQQAQAFGVAVNRHALGMVAGAVARFIAAMNHNPFADVMAQAVKLGK